MLGIGSMKIWSRSTRSDEPLAAPYGVSERGFHKKNCFHDIAKLLKNKPDPVIFDVGAYNGDTAEIFLKYFPDAKLYCFEPTPDLYSELMKKYQGNRNVQVFDYAITDTQDGTCELYEFSESATNSLFPMTNDANLFTDRPVDQKGKVSVRCSTLEKFCADNRIQKIDILKLDVQGGELLVIAGAKQLLMEKRINLILAEVTFVSLYTNQAKNYDLGRILDGYEYSIFDFYNFAYDEKSGQLKWGDALFIPK